MSSGNTHSFSTQKNTFGYWIAMICGSILLSYAVWPVFAAVLAVSSFFGVSDRKIHTATIAMTVAAIPVILLISHLLRKLIFRFVDRVNLRIFCGVYIALGIITAAIVFQYWGISPTEIPLYTKQEVEDLFNDVSDCEGHLMGYSKLQKCQALMAPGLGDDLFRAEGTPDPMICSMSLGRDANSPSPVESQVASERRCRTLSSKNWASTSCEPGLGKSGKDWICFQCDDYAHGETQWVAVDVNCRHGVFYAAYNGQIQWAFDQFRPQSQVPQ